ncbi:MAG: hypothetical protein ACJ71T_15010 [Actinomycetales bacterium]
MGQARSLPFLDEHSLVLPAARDEAWPVVLAYLGSLSRSSHPVLHRALGTTPSSGFEIVESRPPHQVTLAGCHRLSTYRLVFSLRPDGSGTRLVATTYAEFPGLKGRLYRTILMTTHAHQLATRRLLRAIHAGSALRGPT